MPIDGIVVRNSDYIKLKKSKTRRLKPVKKEPMYKNKEDFERVYSELKALDLVAEYYGINIKTAFHWKKSHNIKTIKEYSQQGRKQLNIDKPYADKDWLEKMYAQYSWEDLGKMLNCSPTTLSKWGQKFGIKT
jgi:uncharacterized protein YjcR